MKTFKLVSLKILYPTINGKHHDVQLIDGLVINKEDEERTWLLEAYVDKAQEPFFSKLKEDHQEFKVEATITRKDNDPATFLATIQSVKMLDENMSVLFNCVLTGKADISESLLTELVDEGLQGNELLEQFKTKLLERKSTGVQSK